MLKKIVCLAVSVAMVFSLAAIDVFAVGEGDTDPNAPVAAPVDEGTPADVDNSVVTPDGDGITPDGDNSAVTPDGDGTTPDAGEPVVEPGDGDGPAVDPGEEEPPVVEAPGKVTGLKALADYKSVTLKWNNMEEVDGFQFKLYENGKLIRKPWIRTIEKVSVGSALTTYRVLYSSDAKARMVEGHKYDIYVAAYRLDQEGNKKIGEFVKANKEGPVSALYVKFKGKKSKTPYYTSAKGKKKKGYLKSGKVYTAKGFVCGRYRVMINGKIYFVPKIYGKITNTGYNKTKSDNYTTEEAELFINHYRAGVNDKAGYLVWISLYDQHLYFFKGSKGKWKIMKNVSCNNNKDSHWEISSGKIPTSATATGNWKVQRKIPNRHGLKYWTVFYSGVATHSWGNPGCFGVPHSGGCTRNTVAQAKYIYDRMQKGMTVITY